MLKTTRPFALAWMLLFVLLCPTQPTLAQDIEEFPRISQEMHDKVAYLIEQLKYKRTIYYQEAVRRLSEIGKVALKQLLESIKSEDASIRLGVVEVIRNIGPDAATAIPELIRLATDDEDFYVRLVAIGALGAIGPAASRALPMIVDALTEENSTITHYATNAILSIGVERLSDQSVRTIMGLINTPADYFGYKAESIIIEMKAAAIPYLIEALEEDEHRLSEVYLEDLIFKLGNAGIQTLVQRYLDGKEIFNTRVIKELLEHAPKQLDAVSIYRAYPQVLRRRALDGDPVAVGISMFSNIFMLQDFNLDTDSEYVTYRDYLKILPLVIEHVRFRAPQSYIDRQSVPIIGYLSHDKREDIIVEVALASPQSKIWQYYRLEGHIENYDLIHLQRLATALTSMFAPRYGVGLINSPSEAALKDVLINHEDELVRQLALRSWSLVSPKDAGPHILGMLDSASNYLALNRLMNLLVTTGHWTNELFVKHTCKLYEDMDIDFRIQEVLMDDLIYRENPGFTMEQFERLYDSVYDPVVELIEEGQDAYVYLIDYIKLVSLLQKRKATFLYPEILDDIILDIADNAFLTQYNAEDTLKLLLVHWPDKASVEKKLKAFYKTASQESDPSNDFKKVIAALKTVTTK